MTKSRHLLILSFFITLFSFSARAQCVGDFEVATSTGETVVNVCSGNVSSIVRVAAQIRGFPIMYVLTDENDVILDGGTYPVFNFKNFPPGTCRIYAATFKGTILNTLGQDLATAELTTFCAELSSNFVTVIKGSAETSTIQIAGGNTDTTFCSQDGLDDFVSFEHSVTMDPYVFIITDDQGIILDTTDRLANFEGAPAGTCYVYGMSYDGDNIASPGLHIDDKLATACYALSDNRIAITRVTTDAGMIITDNGNTQEIVCIGDSMSDVLHFLSPGADSSANYVYIVTNDLDTIIGLPMSDSVDFQNAGIGICRVYGVAFTGVLNANLGMYVNDITSGGICQGITSNYVEVIRTSPMEGRIETLQGDTVVNTCPGDSMADIVTVNLMSATGAYIFIITDENNRVLNTSTNQAIDFEGAGEGTCRIYRSTYTGNLIIENGDELFVDDVSDGCFVISTNFVEVRRATPFSGLVGTPTAQTKLDLCVGDGDPDEYTFLAQNNANLPFTFVVTNDSNQILRFLAFGETIDFDGAGSGACRVYGLSYHGDLLIDIGGDLIHDDVATACWDLSNNYVDVTRTNVDPGVIYSQYGTTVFTCPGDGNPDELILTRDTDADTSITFIVDDHGIVLAILNSDTVDLEGAGEGVCRIYGMSFNGQVLLQVGDTLMGQDLATSCFGLTDPIFVLRRVPYADKLATVDGDTTADFCTGDGIPDVLILNYSPSLDFPIQYIITDTFGFILGTTGNDTIDFDGVPSGICRIYGVAYTGFFTGMMGDNIGSSDLADDCYAISSNYIEVIRRQPDGGTVELPNGEDMIYTCPGDGIADVVHFTKTGGSGDPFQYVITSETNVILGIPPADSADFDGAGLGNCRVWAVAFAGNFVAELGDTITRDPLSDGCAGLSSNFITVVRDTAEAGTITTTDGDTLVTVITSDTLSDIIMLQANDASMARSQFVITGQDNLILAVLMDNTLDFGAVPEGEYRLYHISYTGNLVIGGGFDVTIDQISDGCYDVTDNFVRVLVTTSLRDDDENKRQLSLESILAQDQSPELKVYPNPASDRLFLSQTSLADRAMILDGMGRQVAVKQIDEMSQPHFDVSSFKSGLYIVVTYRNGKLIGQQQFLVQ